VQNSTRIFTEFGGKVERKPRKKPLDFGGNPDLVRLGLGSGLGATPPYSTREDVLRTRRLFDGNNFVSSAASAEVHVHTLLSAILVLSFCLLCNSFTTQVCNTITAFSALPIKIFPCAKVEISQLQQCKIRHLQHW